MELATDDQVAVDPKQLETKKKNIPWARLLARVFNIDVEICSKCGSKSHRHCIQRGDLQNIRIISKMTLGKAGSE